MSYIEVMSTHFINQHFHSFHSFFADTYIAPLQVGLLSSAPNSSMAE